MLKSKNTPNTFTQCSPKTLTQLKAEVCHFCETNITKWHSKNKVCFQTGFLATPPTCYWPAKEIIPPETHTIGRASVAVSRPRYTSNEIEERTDM